LPHHEHEDRLFQIVMVTQQSLLCGVVILTFNLFHR
jgi:hypothetical protein